MRPPRAHAGRRPRVPLLALAALALLGACTRRYDVATLDAGRLGEVRLFTPRDEARRLVVLFSDAPGFDAPLAAAAGALAARGTVVVGVDLPRLLAKLATSDDGCHYLVGDVEELSHRVQRERGFARYRSPILAGVGAGATLAYAALAQAPAATVAGAAGVAPGAALRTRVPLCAGAAATASDGGFTYAALDELPGWWRTAPADGAPARALEALLATQLDGDDEPADVPEALSVVEYEGDGRSDVLAVIYSGDGGWRDLDKEIGETLSARGLSVVGVDSLRSFWSPRTPVEMARDLAELIRVYDDRWGTRRVVLIGYSFGAGVLPFAIAELPAPERKRIILVSLLGVAPRADFEIRFTGWLGDEPDEDAPEVLPQILKLDLSRLQCFYGEEEEDSLCRLPALASAEIIRTTGGHHFDGDYAALAARILDGIARRAPGALPSTERSERGE